jgi:hypothetical protein
MRVVIALILTALVWALILSLSAGKINECRHLIGFTQNRDGTLNNVYAPCHHDVCDADPTPKDCG